MSALKGSKAKPYNTIVISYKYDNTNHMDVEKKICDLFSKYCYCIIVISFFIAVIISIILFSILKLNINVDASYYTLSSIFQGLFAILSLAGIFVIFKTDQLSRDNAKYDNIEAFLKRLFDLSSDMKSKTTFKFMQLGDYLDILEYSDKRRGNIEHELKRKNIIQELEKIKIIESGGYENDKLKKDEFGELIGNSEHIIRRIKEKQNLLLNNEQLKHDLIERFKLPFISGMLLIILSIYFLSLINYTPNLFHIPLSIIIVTSVIYTIIVVLEIFYLIYYSMWSEPAKKSH